MRGGFQSQLLFSGSKEHNLKFYDLYIEYGDESSISGLRRSYTPPSRYPKAPVGNIGLGGGGMERGGKELIFNGSI